SYMCPLTVNGVEEEMKQLELPAELLGPRADLRSQAPDSAARLEHPSSTFPQPLSPQLTQ
ncbi:MAG: hypothetical protein ACKOJD_00120, partial [Candidatus Limnocylindrus sp.]